MMLIQRLVAASALALSPAVLAGGDYIGVLRPSAAPAAIAIPESGFYWPLVGPFGGGIAAGPAGEGFKLKLGYRYSRFFSVETGYADLGPALLPGPFAEGRAPGTAFGVDSVGTLPLWTNGSLYGRLGAWRSTGGPSLLMGGEGPSRPGAGLRYGLGFKYDITRHIGVQAEVERLAPLDRWGSREPDVDQVSVGVTWRF